MTTTLGSLLYGLKPITVTASGVDPELFGVMTGMSFDHQACELEVFCRNPLHPGPCKGWKKTLGKIAPGALTAIEKAQKEKTAASRAARAAAKSAAEKHVAGKAELLAHPLKAKKATVEHAETILGKTKGQAQLKAHKTILNKTEIKKYAKLKGAQIGQIAASRGLTSDEKKYAAYAESRIADALAKDNLEGGHKHYDNLLSGLSQALSGGFADKHCGVGKSDADCDGLLHEGLRALAEQRLMDALTTGNTDGLDKLEADVSKLDNQGKHDYLAKQGVDLKAIKDYLYEGEEDAGPTAPEPAKTTEPGGAKKAAFEKGEKTKMDKLAADYESQKKAVGSADAVQLLASMTSGKKLTSAQEAALIKNLQDAHANGTVGQHKAAALTGLAHIFGKTETYTGVKLSNQDKARVEKEMLDALEHGTPTPLLEAIRKSWQSTADEYGAPGKNPGGADILAKAFEHPMTSKPGAPTSLDNPVAKAVATGINADIIKALNENPDAWDGLSPAMKEVVGQKLYTENTIGDGVTQAVTANLINKHKIPHPTTGKVEPLLPGAHQPAEVKALVDAAGAPGVQSQAVQDVLYYLHTPGVMTGPKLKALDELTYNEYQALDPADKALVEDLLKSLPEGHAQAQAIAKAFDIDLKKKDAPDVESAKISAPGVPATQQIGPGAVALNDLQQEVAAVAQGAKSMVDTKKLELYEKLSGAEFGQLSPTSQKLILAQLDKMEAKFLDPKKQTRVKLLRDKFTAHTGGGAGAGGKLDTTAPAGVPAAPNVPTPAVSTKLTNEDIGKQAAAEMSDLISSVGMKPFDAKDVASTGTVIGKLLDNKQDAVFDTLASQYTDDVMGKVDFQLPTGELMKFGDPLKADIKAKLMGTGADTPVLDAFKKAAKSKDHADLVALDAAADAWHAANSTGGPTPKVIEQEAKEYAASFEVLKKYASGGKPAVPGAAFGVIHEYLKSDGLGNFATDTGLAMSLGRSLASLHMHRTAEELGFTSNQIQDWKNNGFWDVMLDSLGATYGMDLVNKVDDEPLGLAAEISDLTESVQEKGKALAQANGWPEDAPAVLDWKKTYFENKALSLLPKSVAAKVTKPAPPGPFAPVTTPKPATPTTFGGANIHGISEPDQHILFSAYKSMPSGTVLSSPISDQYDNLVAIAAHYAGQQGSGHTPSLYVSEMTKFPQDLSVAQVAKIVDARLAASMGKGNANILENNIIQWLATKEGAEYAAKATPKPHLMKALTGYSAEADKIKLKPGEKVQKLPGPGKYVATKGVDDFARLRAHEIQQSQEDYFTASGSHWTPDQVEALANYTTGSYHDINSYLRGVDRNGNPVTTTSDLTKTRIKMIQAGMRPLQQDTLLRRGTGWEQFPEGFRSPDQIKKLIGKTVREPAFMSTTVGGEGGGFFDESVLMHIEAPTGTRGAWVNHISHNKSENEVVLAAGSKFRILDVYPNPDNPGQTIVRVRVVS